MLFTHAQSSYIAEALLGQNSLHTCREVSGHLCAGNQDASKHLFIPSGVDHSGAAGKPTLTKPLSHLCFPTLSTQLAWSFSFINIYPK